MKAEEAPEKLYVDANDNPDDTWFYAFTTPSSKGEDIEYVRKDVFVEKAAEFLSKEANLPLLEGYNGTFECDRKLLIKNFRNYMKGE